MSNCRKNKGKNQQSWLLNSLHLQLDQSHSVNKIRSIRAQIDQTLTSPESQYTIEKMTILSGFLPLDEVSILVSIDGEGCGEHSTLGWWGLLIWIPFVIYLMVGQFVICEEYFVPVLAMLGDRWNMAEDVQGATLLAVGSSSPELFTALLGVILYPDDNPGPGTNVGSAVFNMCIIIGLSAIFAPQSGIYFISLSSLSSH